MQVSCSSMGEVWSQLSLYPTHFVTPSEMAFSPPVPWNSWTSSTEPFPRFKPHKKLSPASSKTPDDISPSDWTPPSEPADGGKPHQCQLCPKSYKNTQSLGRHLREGHGGQNGIAPAPKHTCAECGLEYQRPEGLKTHCEREHGGAQQASQDADLTIRYAEGGDVETGLSADDGQDLTVTSNVLSYHAITQRMPPVPRSSWPVFGLGVDLNEPQRLRLERLERAGQVVTEMRTLYDAQRRYETMTTPLNKTRYAQLQWDSAPRRAKNKIPPPDWKTYCRVRGKKISPPIPGWPEPQDLEILIRREERRRRFHRFMNYFRETHAKFQHESSEPPDPELQCMMDINVLKALRPHKEDVRRAFKDGLSAIRKILAGVLPDRLDAALGIAEVASAICKMVGEKETSTVSEDDFLSDLSRLKVTLESAHQAAYDYYTSLLWGDRPLEDVVWEGVLDGENLIYLQDLLSKLLLNSGFEIIDKNLSESETALEAHLASVASHKASGSLDTASSLNMSCQPPLASDGAEGFKTTTEPIPAPSNSWNETAQGPTLQLNFVLMAAGAIFGLVMIFVLCKTPSSFHTPA